MSRSKKSFQRIYHSEAYMEHIRSLPCVCCGEVGYSVAAHTESGGMGRKAGWETIVPLCSNRYDSEGCHEESHRIGVKSFEAKYRLDLKALARETSARWTSESS